MNEKRFSRFISYLFHPAFMPTYGLIILFFCNIIPEFNTAAYSSYRNEIFYILGLNFLFTALIPILFAAYLNYKGMIKSMHMNTIQERWLPMLCGATSHLVGWSVLLSLGIANAILMQILLLSFMAVAITLMITLTWKISVHMIAVGGITGSLIMLSALAEINLLTWIIGSVIVAGLVGFSRLTLKAHGGIQIYSGFFLGCLILQFPLFIKLLT